VTPKVAAALDRTNTSDRKAAHIFSAMGSTGQLKEDVEELIISPSAIRRARMKHRKLFSSEVRATFDPAVPLIVHWDGKIMDNFTGLERGKVDRLPILVSGHDVIKLLCVPKLRDGTAATMAQAVTQGIDDWGLRDRIKGLCFDTTASNAGTKSGVCIRLDRLADSYSIWLVVITFLKLFLKRFSVFMMSQSLLTWSCLATSKTFGLVLIRAHFVLQLKMRTWQI